MTVSSAAKLQINSHWGKNWCKLSQPRPAVFCGLYNSVLRCSAVFRHIALNPGSPKP